MEAENQNGKIFDEKKLAVYVKNHVTQPVDVLTDGILESAKNLAVKFKDDVTIVVLKVL